MKTRAASTEKEPQLGLWLSFADGSKPKGQMFVGVVILRAHTLKTPGDILSRCRELNLWPDSVKGLDVEILPVDLNDYDPADIERMLSKEDAMRLGNQVTVSKKVCTHGQSA